MPIALQRTVLVWIVLLTACGGPKDKTHPQTERVSQVDYNVIMENSVVEGFPVRKFKLCDLKVQGDRIVTADPLTNPELAPLERRVKPGLYPVYLYVTKTEETGERVALAVLEFKKDKANRFILAAREGQDLSKLSDPDEYSGFVVDSGLGAFYDDVTSRQYLHFMEEFESKHPNGNIYDDLLADLFKQNARPANDASDWLCFQIPDTNQATVAMFSSGYGDGVYPSYWGLDSAGETCNLVIDFEVLLGPKGGDER